MLKSHRSLCVASSSLLLILLLFTQSFSHQRKLMLFHWGFSESKSPQVSRTLLGILAVLNNAVVWMVFTRPPNFKSPSPFNNPLMTLPNAPITIGIIVTFMFLNFFSALKECEKKDKYIDFDSRFTYPSFHILSVLFCGQSEQQSQ